MGMVFTCNNSSLDVWLSMHITLNQRGRLWLLILLETLSRIFNWQNKEVLKLNM